jgi:hypothetical protein
LPPAAERWGGTYAGAVTHLGPMGFDPNRPQVRRPSDYLFVGAAVVLCIALLAWAFLG